MPFDLNKYFERIGYKGKTDVSAETLRQIHAAQVFSIPFENLTIHEVSNVNNPDDFIHLDPQSVFKKLVVDKRGGYCHENNELLALALLELGFKVTRLAARVLTGPDLPKSHKLLLITIDEQAWIADVGFGGYGLLEPMPLTLDKDVEQYTDRFKIILENDNYVLQAYNNGNWKSLYCFDLKPHSPADFKQMSYFVSHYSDSIFVKNRICVMPRPQGRVILNNYQLKVIENKEEKVFELRNEEEYLQALKKYFGIVLDERIQLKQFKHEERPEKKQQSSANNVWCAFFAGSLLTLGSIAAAVYFGREDMQVHANRYP